MEPVPGETPMLVQCFWRGSETTNEDGNTEARTFLCIFWSQSRAHSIEVLHVPDGPVHLVHVDVLSNKRKAFEAIKS